MTELMDKYTDYLIAGFSLGAVTKAVDVLGVSKDRLSRFLGGVRLFTKGDKKGNVESHVVFDNQLLWNTVKKEIRESELLESAMLIVDDTIIAKPYTDENEIVSYHYDHCSGTNIKGINILNGGLYYSSQDKYIPIFVDVVSKTEKYTIIDKEGKEIEKRRSAITKNQMFQNQFNQVMKNHIKLDYTVFDIWFGSVDNLSFIHNHHQHYICPIKNNRKMALSLNEKKQGQWYKLEQITSKLDTQTSLPIWLEGCTHMSYLTKQLFTNQDEQGNPKVIVMYLITNDSTLTKDQVYTTYQKRWKVEQFHKSLKSNLALSKSPTKHKVSQTNHIFCSILAFFKLETLTKLTTYKNHFQFKSSLYLKALQSAYVELQVLRSCER